MELHGHFNATAGERLLRGRRVMYAPNGRVVLADAVHPGVGSIASKDFASGEVVSVRPLFDPGIHQFVNAGGIIKPGDAVYAAVDGKVSATGTVLVGYAVDSGYDISVNGDVAAVVPCLFGGENNNASNVDDRTSLTSDTYANIKALATAGKLIPGNLYEINDYETIYVQPVSLDVRHDSANLFNVIVRALSPSRFAPEAWASPTTRTQPAGAMLTDSTPLGSWRLLYDINNDASLYEWAVPAGKGVIYRMVDHFANDLPYDFYNVKFRRYLITATTTPATSLVGKKLSPTQEKTGLTIDPAQYDDLPTFDLSLSVYANRFGPSFLGTKIRSLNNNTFGGPCNNNTFGSGCSGNTFVNNCNSNTFGNGCSGNAFGNGCAGNTFASDYLSNTFGNNCNSNTFGSRCSGNAFGGVCENSVFGSKCYNNTFGPSSVAYITVAPGVASRNFMQKDIYSKTHSQTISVNAGNAVEIRWYDLAGTMQRQ